VKPSVADERPPTSSNSAPSRLQRNLSQRQLMMIVMGSAIGTGLFLGSGLAIHLGGPAVILGYLFSSGLALMISWALAEMSVAHPSAGSLGVFASTYLSPWAGYIVMISYWGCAVISIGQEILAASIYCQYWYPGFPQWVLVATFALALVWVNSWSVGHFGEFEYWFAMIKVATITLFILFSIAILLGVTRVPSPRLSNFTAQGGFLPNGVQGLWFAVPFALISFFGIELISVTAGEVQNPTEAIPRASRAVVLRLIVFYVISITLLLAIAPWRDIGIRVSPFVFAFEAVRIPGASMFMNFVVLTAALSGANSSLYAATRMLYSMSNDGLAPQVFRGVSRKGVPIPALLGSAGGLAAATLAAVFIPARAFMFMIAAAYFQIMLVWIVILLSYSSFRRIRRPEERRVRLVRGHPYTTTLAIASLVGILVTTWWIPSMKITMLSGIAWMLATTVYYFLLGNRSATAEEKLPA
jgi:AAT family amino acid transporter